MAVGIVFFVVGVLIALIWILIETKRMKHKIFAIFLISVILFFYLSMSFVFKGKNVDYKTISGLMSAGKVYFSWLGAVVHNINVITTNAIHMNWNSGNQTFIR